MDDEFLNADEEDFETDDYEEVDEEEEDEEEAEAKGEGEGDTEQEESPPPAPTDHVVHIYECGKFKRTIEREFTAEDAEEFASDYNRTARPYSRFALAAKAKSRPKKTVSWPTFKGAIK